MHENAKLIADGDDRPELRQQFLDNLVDLERYEAGRYDAFLDLFYDSKPTVQEDSRC